MENDRLLYRIALTQIKGVGIILARALMKILGDEELVFKASSKELKSIQGISHKLVDEIRNPEVLRKAEKEVNFIIKNNLSTYFFTDENYPQRLASCVDAPILLYGKGNIDTNPQKVVSIVGTRLITYNGKEFCQKFINVLSKSLPDVQIISGLAYGADICAHRAALQNNLSTIGVLAHGLDRIYPAVHRKTAVEMLDNGGLLTEFPSETNPDKHNFVKRNRIVAGMADTLVVIESGEKGGSLITADIANSYYRKVFAVPGRPADSMSVGCNRLIMDNKAILLQDTESFLNHLGWNIDNAKKEPVQKQIFLQLTEEEEKIFNALNGTDGMQVNMLAIELNTPVSELFMTLLELEMKNIVKALPGGVYKLH